MAFVARYPKPKPKSPASPAADPRFKKVADQLKKGSANLKKHPPASKKAADAQKAARPPANEKLAGAKANQVDTMKEAKTEKPQPNAFLALLRAEIEKVMPQNLDEADKFMEGGEQEQMKGAVTGKVGEQKDDATKEIKGASEQPPDTGKVKGKEVTPAPADPATPAPVVQGGAGMPAPKAEAAISQKENKDSADQMMKDAEVTPTQLKKANDPRFSAVLTQKTNVEKTADAAPAKYRAAEKGVLGKAVSQAQAQAKMGVAVLLATKGKAGSAVASKQAAAKERDEKRRKEVTDNIEKIFNETKQKVDAKLASLETDVTSIFDAGANAAISNMKNNSKREIEKFKDERYSGPTGWGRWIADQFRPVPPEIKAILQRNRTQFTSEMDALVVRIANTVESRLNQAKSEIDKGQGRIKTYVASLPKDLQAVGKAAEKEMASRFDEMRKGVDDKQNELAQKLAQKYKEAHDKADEELKKIEEANKGALSGFIEAIGEVIKMLMEFKAKLMALLKKGEETIKLIIADPIGFLSNLIAAIKQGLNQFVGNIWTHLKAGFMQWLFGALAGAGIQIPSDLSLPSILKLVLSVLGLTYERLRAKAVKLIGERNVKILEKLFEYVKTLITEGPAALWEKVKEDLSNLKAMVIDAIQDWIVTTIVKAAISKLVTMFNPAGAIVQAVIAIYNTVMFLIERASQIMAFVEAVINSISAIAQGAIGGAATWIEQSLARMIPLLIGFLARLIGLGGISQKIKEIITKVQGAVDKAIDKVLAKIVATVKKLFGKGKDAKGKPDKADDDKSKAVKAKAAKDLSARLGGAATYEKAKAAIGGTFSLLKAEGLKSLKVVKDKSRPKGFRILASASLETDVQGFTLQGKDKPAQLKIIYQLSAIDRDTSLFVRVNGTPIGTYPIQNIPDGDHAEEIFIKKHIGGIAKTAKAEFKKTKKKTALEMSINRAPCGPQEHNCASKMAGQAVKHKEYLSFSLGIVGGVGKFDKETKTSTLLTTTDDLKIMAKAGIKLSAMKVWDGIRQKIHPGKTKFFIAVKNVNLEAELEALIKKADAEMKAEEETAKLQKK